MSVFLNKDVKIMIWISETESKKIPPWLLGRALCGQNLDLALVVFVAPNQETKYVFICPIN